MYIFIITFYFLKYKEHMRIFSLYTYIYIYMYNIKKKVFIGTNGCFEGFCLFRNTTWTIPGYSADNRFWQDISSHL